MNWNRIFIKLDRFFAWILLASMLFYFLSGYGITKSIINAQFSYNLHTIYLPIILLISFVGHTSYAIHLALRRWRVWNGYTKAVLVMFYAAFLIFFLYIQMFYKPNSQANNSTASSDNTNPNNSSSAVSTNSPANAGNQTVPNKAFTLAELAKYDGQNGTKAYVAVDGIIYDVTAVFIQGRHFSHLAGRELTNAFYTRHAKSAITKYPVVGRLK